MIDAGGSDGPLSKQWLSNHLSRLDDGHVYRSEFLVGLILINTKSTRQDITPEAQNYLRNLGNKWQSVGEIVTPTEVLISGPYLYMDKVLRKVYRLQSDIQRAFMAATRPDLSET